MTKSFASAHRATLCACSLTILALAAGPALAADETPPASTDAPEVREVIITAPRGQAAEAAPVKGSLTAKEPEAVITRQFIEEVAPRVGDFTTTAMLAPSMAGVPNANGPGATDGAKITMRGFADGEFNITYDGIAWGDTNGPSHHANSFFPSSVIGGVVIDRGPGTALDMGQASFGGSLNLYSLPLEDHLGLRQTATVGSWGTLQSVTTLTSGPQSRLHDANFLANFMEYKTDGYLTNSASQGQNQFFKIGVPITDRIAMTVVATHNNDSYYQGDSNATASVAQTEAFGKRFALSNDPSLQTYYKYNFTKKSTDFEYVRLNGDLGQGWGFENTAYTYWYSNKTLSANDGTADSTIGAAALAAANKVILAPAATYPNGGSGYSSALKVAGLPGYTKRNEYRVGGEKLVVTKDTGFGLLTLGGLWEIAKTQRQRFDIDLLTRQPDYREKAAVFPGPTGCNGLPQTVAPGKTWNGACQEPLNIAYNEYSGWHQYQVFGQFEWKPTEQLTVTPGVKFVNFQLHLEAPALAVKGSIQPFFGGDTYRKTLPYLTVNYRVQPDLAVYAQYAQGFLVPNVSAFYVNTPTTQKIVPQESTAYQAGVVWNHGKLVVDADVYTIDFKHKIQTVTDLSTSETFETNSGGATYKGVEAQATYLLPHGFSVFGNYSHNDAIGKDDPANPGYNGYQLAKAPKWTAAGGLRSHLVGLFTSEDSLTTNLVGKWIGPQYATAASGAAPPTAILKTFGEGDLTSTYRIGRFSFEAQVINLMDSRDITSFKGKALIAGTNLPAQTSAQGGAANVFSYQSGRSFQFTLKAVF
ncbi:MAG: TonB-dependent receptor [Proteobacteria bacterium]|nr:TonB-dependent receptor [Pseudomonadota bacterium]